MPFESIKGLRTELEPRFVKIEEAIANLERSNTAVCRRLDEIELRITKLENPIQSQVVEIKKAITTNTEQHFPVPTDYTEAVNTLLNSKFGVKIEPFSDRPQFMFTIIVPKEYSDNKGIVDLRSKVLNYADGINGVREWVTKVYESFNPEVKAKIKIDL